MNMKELIAFASALLYMIHVHVHVHKYIIHITFIYFLCVCVCVCVWCVCICVSLGECTLHTTITKLFYTYVCIHHTVPGTNTCIYVRVQVQFYCLSQERYASTTKKGKSHKLPCAQKKLSGSSKHKQKVCIDQSRVSVLINIPATALETLHACIPHYTYI